MKQLPVIILFVALLYGCGKTSSNTTCTNISPASEETTITAYCSANGITAVKDTSGLFYQIVNPGTPPMPDINDTVSVTFTGKYLNGTVFSQSAGTPPHASLSAFIDGWIIGLQKIGKGGQMKMVIPSALAYGCQGYYSIPPNEILYFDITLADVIKVP